MYYIPIGAWSSLAGTIKVSFFGQSGHGSKYFSVEITVVVEYVVVERVVSEIVNFKTISMLSCLHDKSNLKKILHGHWSMTS